VAHRLEVVLVEDDDGLRNALARYLGIAGFDARAYATAESALDDRTWAGAACLVVDVGLPGASGLDLLDRLTPAEKAIPVVVMSGYDDPGTRNAAHACGISTFIAKPVDARTIVAAVRRAIQVKSSMGGRK
jgi:FixJ family two-component response regulator